MAPPLLLLLAALTLADLRPFVGVPTPPVEVLTFLAVALALAAAASTGLLSFLWHDLTNAFAERQPRALRAPWVIDGDTIEDRAAGARYRVANIDAPETGENAKCFRERHRGELAKREAIRLVRGARSTQVRRTWRTDRYGRRVAFVLVDGQDLGEALMKRGLARPWRGRRERWCGPRGGLAKIAETGAMPFSCETCAGWTSRRR
jgi:endonuclease YncB( thermonuclease family)